MTRKLNGGDPLEICDQCRVIVRYVAASDPIPEHTFCSDRCRLIYQEDSTRMYRVGEVTGNV